MYHLTYTNLLSASPNSFAQSFKMGYIASYSFLPGAESGAKEEVDAQAVVGAEAGAEAEVRPRADTD